MHNVVEKTIFYESEATFGGWRDETGVLVHEDFTYYMTPFFDFIENIVPSYFTVDEIDASQPNTHDNIYQVINDGVMTFTYYGHGTPNGWSAGGYLDMSYLMNNLTNTFKTPVVHGVACETGHFDKSGDCFGEGLVTYSETEGFTGYIGASRSVHQNQGTSVSNPPERFQELMLYTIFHDLSHITGEYILESKTVYPSSCQGEYSYAFNFFGDPALNIMAQGFEVTHDITLPAVATISTGITVRNGATLTVPLNGELRFENDGKLILEEDATLNIMNNARLSGVSGIDSLIVYGNIYVGNDVSFIASGEGSFVFDIRNDELVKTISSATFNNVTFSGIASTLIFSSCDFTDSYVEMHKIVNNRYFCNESDFDNTPVIASAIEKEPYPDLVSTIKISGCDFINGSGLSVIEINGFPKFQITNTNLSYEEGDGISLYYSGNAVGTTHEISDCEIHFIGESTEGTHGIKAHYSRIDIENNYVHGNDIGLACLQGSSVSLTGNSQAYEESETQQIKDNISIQVYSYDGNSLPYEFEYNAIYNYSEDDYVVMMENSLFTGYDIRNNYWGENFSPENDFSPANAYAYLPVWEPTWAGDKSTDEAKVLYYAAKQDIIDSNYAEARIKFEQLIENYPGSKYQNEAVKEIFQVTIIYDQDYAGLKLYLDTVPVLWENNEISGITEYIMIWCDIMQQNYPTAISWFEERILNPINYADSILSIIDLGYVYSLMEGGSNRWSGYTGKLLQYRPASQRMYAEYREYLIDLLTQGQSKASQNTTETKDNKPGWFIKSYPNPVIGEQITLNY